VKIRFPVWIEKSSVFSLLNIFKRKIIKISADGTLAARAKSLSFIVEK
jgi:hypothetical protein